MSYLYSWTHQNEDVVPFYMDENGGSQIVRASRDIASGTVILSEYPFLTMPNILKGFIRFERHDISTRTCVVCGKEPIRSRCPSCRLFVCATSACLNDEMHSKMECHVLVHNPSLVSNSRQSFYFKIQCTMSYSLIL